MRRPPLFSGIPAAPAHPETSVSEKKFGRETDLIDGDADWLPSNQSDSMAPPLTGGTGRQSRVAEEKTRFKAGKRHEGMLPSL